MKKPVQRLTDKEPPYSQEFLKSLHLCHSYFHALVDDGATRKVHKLKWNSWREILPPDQIALATRYSAWLFGKNSPFRREKEIDGRMVTLCDGLIDRKLSVLRPKGFPTHHSDTFVDLRLNSRDHAVKVRDISRADIAHLLYDADTTVYFVSNASRASSHALHAGFQLNAHGCAGPSGYLSQVLRLVEVEVQYGEPLDESRMESPRVCRRSDAAETGKVNGGRFGVPPSAQTDSALRQSLEQDGLGDGEAGEGVDFVDEQNAVLFEFHERTTACLACPQPVCRDHGHWGDEFFGENVRRLGLPDPAGTAEEKMPRGGIASRRSVVPVGVQVRPQNGSHSLLTHKVLKDRWKHVYVGCRFVRHDEDSFRCAAGQVMRSPVEKQVESPRQGPSTGRQIAAGAK